LKKPLLLDKVGILKEKNKSTSIDKLPVGDVIRDIDATVGLVTIGAVFK
jgi:hypothetical protein